MPEPVCIKNTQSPGDYIVLTAALRDITLCYPGVFQFTAATPEPDIWRNNPLVKHGDKRGIRRIVARYSSPNNPYRIHKSNQARAHFMWSFLADLNLMLKTHAVLTDFRPALYLTEEEKATPLLQTDKPYWVMVAGGKRDFTAKWWDKDRWQQVVDRVKDRVTVVQVGGGSHIHPRLTGVHDLVAKTSFRELMRLIYHSHGVFCIVTCLMHIAAAFNKPCVTVAGGREPWWWEAYNEENRLANMRIGRADWKPPEPDTFIPHRYIYLECDKPKWSGGRGCWKSKLEGGNKCEDIVATQTGLRLPHCLDKITAERVVKEFEWYYENEILSLDKKLILPPIIPAIPSSNAYPTPQAYVPSKSKAKVPKGRAQPTPLWHDVAKPAPEPNLDKTHLFVYLGGQTRLDYLNQIRERSPRAALTAVCNTASGEVDNWCKHNAAEAVMDGAEPGRPEMLYRALSDAKREQLVWIEYPVMPRAGHWGRYLTPFPDKSFGGCFYWQRITDGHEQLMKSSPWAKGWNPRQHGTEGFATMVFPLRGYLVLPRSLVGRIEWACRHVPDAAFELVLGALLSQWQTPLLDLGHTVEHQ